MHSVGLRLTLYVDTCSLQKVRLLKLQPLASIPDYLDTDFSISKGVARRSLHLSGRQPALRVHGPSTILHNIY